MSSRGFSKVPSKDVKYVKNELGRISEKVQKRRKELGLTQEDVAEQLEVSVQTIQFIENSRRIPSLPMLIRLAKVLKFEVLN